MVGGWLVAHVGWSQLVAHDLETVPCPERALIIQEAWEILEALMDGLWMACGWMGDELMVYRWLADGYNYN